MDGQISIFDMEYEFADLHYDRDEKPHTPPEWMKFERCENCIRWIRYSKEEQPPSGWGIKGYCLAHSQKVESCGYCNSWENKFLGDLKNE